MSDDDYSLATAIALEFFPGSLQQKIIADRVFLKALNVPVSTIVTFLPANVRFSVESLFECAKKLLSEGHLDAKTEAEDGSIWKATVSDRDMGCITLASEGVEILVTDYWPVFDASKDRLRIFAKTVSSYQLAHNVTSYWRNKLTSAALNAIEITDLEKELQRSLVSVENKIRHEINGGSSKIRTLVPVEVEFWGNTYPISRQWPALNVFVEESIVPWLDAGIEDHGPRFFTSALRACSHSSIAAQFDLSRLSTEERRELTAHVLNSGSLFSKLGFVEAFLAQDELDSTEMGSIASIVDSLLDEPEAGRYEILSSLYFFVCGQLSLTSFFEDAPIFVRRLSEFAHASFLEEILISENIDAHEAAMGLGRRFVRRAFVAGHLDGHSAARWMPELALPQQLKAEFICRLNNAFSAKSVDLLGSELERFVMEGSEHRISNFLSFPFSFLPGPLEGGLDSPTNLPESWKVSITNSLNEDPPSLGGFNGLVNGGAVFKLPADIVSLSVAALRKVQLSLPNDDEFSLGAFVLGLAKMAAICKNDNLADEVWLLLKRSIKLRPDSIEPTSLISLPLILSGAYPQDGRDKRMCEMIEFLACTELTSTQGTYLLSSVNDLLDMQPALWPMLGRCVAILEAQTV